MLELELETDAQTDELLACTKFSLQSDGVVTRPAGRSRQSCRRTQAPAERAQEQAANSAPVTKRREACGTTVTLGLPETLALENA